MAFEKFLAFVVVITFDSSDHYLTCYQIWEAIVIISSRFVRQ